MVISNWNYVMLVGLRIQNATRVRRVQAVIIIGWAQSMMCMCIPSIRGTWEQVDLNQSKPIQQTLFLLKNEQLSWDSNPRHIYYL